MIGEAGVQINYISNKELDNMCGGVHQGVAAVIKDYEYYSLDAIIAKSKKQEKNIHSMGKVQIFFVFLHRHTTHSKF